MVCVSHYSEAGFITAKDNNKTTNRSSHQMISIKKVYISFWKIHTKTLLTDTGTGTGIFQ